MLAFSHSPEKVTISLSLVEASHFLHQIFFYLVIFKQASDSHTGKQPSRHSQWTHHPAVWCHAWVSMAQTYLQVSESDNQATKSS